MGKMNDEYMRQREFCFDLIDKMRKGEITEDDARQQCHDNFIGKNIFDDEYASYEEFHGEFNCGPV
jgi:hypothetical protein